MGRLNHSEIMGDITQTYRKARTLSLASATSGRAGVGVLPEDEECTSNQLGNYMSGPNLAETKQLRGILNQNDTQYSLS